MTDKVVSLFGEEALRKTAYECLAGRLEEIEEGDQATDVLILTMDHEGSAIRTNCGGIAESLLMLETFKSMFLSMHMYPEEFYDD